MLTPKHVFDRLFENFGNQHWWPVSSENEQFEIIIGAILTQNTSWKNVEKVLETLKKEGLIHPEKMIEIQTKKLAELIRPSGYYNQKAERLKIVSQFLLENDLAAMGVEWMRKKLLEIKGVGPETADSIILYAFNKPSFVVDLYTKRIFSRLGLINNNSSYNEVKQFFETNLEKDVELFQEFHALIVEHAKSFCKKKPDCENCFLRKNCKKLI